MSYTKTPLLNSSGAAAKTKGRAKEKETSLIEHFDAPTAGG